MENLKALLRGIEMTVYQKKLALDELEKMKKDAILNLKNIMDEDTENRHIEADSLMCKILNVFGFDEFVEKFEELHKLYA